MRLRDRAVQFVRLLPVERSDGLETELVACVECAALVADDPEGANRKLHEQSHRDTWAMLRALRDGKVDNGLL